MNQSVSLEELSALNDEIASLVRAGVPLDLGLRELAGDAGGALGEISTALAGRMRSGVSLAEALRAEERTIPPMYRAVVEAGLRAGRLPAALESMSNFARELVELRRRIGLALLYPLIVVALAYALFVVFLVELVDRFRETYEMFRIPVHGLMRVSLVVAEAVSRAWWVFPVALAALLVWWVASGGSRILSFGGPARPLAWIPGVAEISRCFQYANFADLLALLVEHEVPLPEALRLSAEATGDDRLQSAARQMGQAVEQGQSPGADAGARWGFPPFLYWVLMQGGRSNALARLLRHAGSVYRRRAVNRANWFKLVFPVVTAVFIGGGVALMYALTLFGPLATFWNDLVIE